MAERSIEGKGVLAIGDTRGDLVMRGVCGSFACPSNAIQPVKDAADYVSPFPLLDGVLDIIGHFCPPSA